MTELNVRTKGGASPKDKPRVYFTCHPADLERGLEKLCEDLFTAADCAVYYTPDMGDRLPEETRETDLERMTLFVIPVSLKLLLEPSRAMDEDFPFAREKNIPVLPVMLEGGLDPIYGRADRFGPLQYLDPEARDDTAVPYAEKLKKHLDSLFIDPETTKRVRNAFDDTVFLSYRKKDRRKANALMRLIHADPLCRDVAVWFDEYLTPGESFSASIRKAMERSRYFALLVTPSLLEKNEKGEPNYVRATEYPAARDAGMPLLPAELPEGNEDLTDREALARDFPGLPAPHDLRRGSERERFLSPLRALSREDGRDDPEHLFLMGLAYLEGIDVEVDREHGLALLTAAGEAENLEAMKKLCTMYFMGQGVPLDWRQAAFWAEKEVEYTLRDLGEEHPEHLNALQSLAAVYRELGDYPRALELSQRAYDLLCKVKGEEEPWTLAALTALASNHMASGDGPRALELQERAYDLLCKVKGEEEPWTLAALINLAMAHEKLGQYQKALELSQRAYDQSCQLLGEENPATLKALNNLAGIHLRLGDHRRALELQERAYERSCRAQGEEHPDTLRALSNLAETHEQMGNHREALELRERVYELSAGVLGEEHPFTLTALNSLGESLITLGDYPNARAVLEQAVALQEELLGEEHPETLASKANLGYAFSQLGELQEARELEERVCALRLRDLGEEHPDTLMALNNLAATCMKQGEYPRARELLEKCYPLRCKVLGEKHRYTLASLGNLATLYYEMGELEAALPRMERVYALECEVLGEEHPDTLMALTNLAVLCDKMGDRRRSLPLQEKALAQFQKVKGADHPDTLGVMENLAQLYWDMGSRRQQAIKLWNRAKALRRRTKTAFPRGNASNLPRGPAYSPDILRKKTKKKKS